MAYIPSECSIEEYENQIYSGDSKHRLYIKHGNTIVENASPFVSKLTWKRRILNNGATIFSLSNFVSQEIDLVLHDYQITNLKEEIELKIGTYIESVGDYVFIPLGIFVIQDNPTTDKNKTTYKLRDKSVYFDFNYNAKDLIDNSEKFDEENNSYVTKLDILLDICNKAKVEYIGSTTFIGYDDKISIYDNSITGRKYISYLFEQAGLIPIMTRDGKLDNVNIKNLVTKQISPTLIEKFEKGDTYEIAKIVYETGAIKFETEPSAIIEGNSLIVENALEKNIKELQIEGNYHQETRSEKNLLNINSYISKTNVTVDDNDWINVNYDNTNGSNTFFCNMFTKITPEIKANTVYTIVCEVKEISHTGEGGLQISNTNNSFALPGISTISFNDISAPSIIINTLTSVEDLTNVTGLIRNYVSVRAGSSVNITYRLSVIEENGITEDTFIYEPYGAMPSPEFPSEIKNVGTYNEETEKYEIEVKVTGKNLFDKNNTAQIFKAYLSYDAKKIVTYENNRTTYIPVVAGKTYAIKKFIGSSKLTLATSSTEPSIGSNIENYFAYDTLEATYTIPENQNYLIVFVVGSADLNAGYTVDEILSNVQIEEGSISTEYEPYKEDIITLILDAPLRALPNGVKDVATIKDGKLIVERKVGSVILDGSETIATHTLTNEIRGFRISSITDIKPNDSNILCNYLKSVLITDYNSSNRIYGTISTLEANASNPYLYITQPNAEIDTTSELKTWLSENKPRVDYELKEPIIEDLGQVTPIKTFEGFNEITNTYNANMILEYYYDTKNVKNLYINSANPYITKQADIDRLKDLVGFKINSFKTGKIMGNPTIDPYDLIETTYNDIIYKTLAQYTLNFVGTMTSTFDTTIKYEAKQTNVYKNSESAFRKYVKTEIDNTNGALKIEAGRIDTNEEDIATLKISSSNVSIDLSSQKTAIDEMTTNQTNFENAQKDLKKEVDKANESLGKTGEQIKQMSYNFTTEALRISSETSKINALFNNSGVYVFNFEKLTSIFSDKGSGFDKLIVTGTAQIGYLKFVKNFKNNKKCTTIYHLNNLIEDLEDLESD